MICDQLPDNLSEFLSIKKSRLPKHRLDAFYAKSKHLWASGALLEKARRGEPKAVWHPALLCVEPASSSMSKCRICGKAIVKGATRIAFAVGDPRGQYGIIGAWLHIGCAASTVQGIYGDYDGDLATQADGDENADGEEDWTKSLSEGHFRFFVFLKTLCIGYLDFTHDERKEILEELLKEEPGNESGPIEIDDFVKRVLTARHPPPEDLMTSLLPFQEEGLAWMAHQEESEARGGVLADEMGMGKTVQAIGLMLARRVFGSKHRNLHLQDPEAADGPKAGANLVVAPLAAVLQWQGEIEKFTRPNSLEVLIYHGSNRKLLEDDLLRADVVITTYATIESDYRRIVNKHKLECEFCGRKFLPGKLRLHLTYICGPDAQRTEKQALKERSRGQATAKAMETLNIGALVPTPANLYREIMMDAGRYKEAEDLSGVPWLSYKKRSPIPSPQENDSDRRKRRRLPMEDCVEETPPPAPRFHPPDEDHAASPSARRRRPTVISDDEQESERQVKSEPAMTEEVVSTPQKKSHSEPTTSDELDAYQLHKISVATLRKIGDHLGMHGVAEMKKIDLIRTFREEVFGIQDDGKVPSVKTRSPPPLLPPSVKKRKATKRERVETKMPSSESEWLGTTSDSESESSSDASEFLSTSSAPESSSFLESSVKPARTKRRGERAKGATTKGTRPTMKGKAKSKTAKNEKARGMKETGDDEDSETLADNEAMLEEDVDLSNSPLHAIEWKRIILDEAHRIKSRTTSTAKGVLALPSLHYRWCLTGTPLQNRVGELYSLIRFLRYDPYAFYFCSKRGCDCKMLNYSFKDNRFCKQCGHTKMVHFSYFNKKIAKPIVAYGYSGEGKESLMTLRKEVLDVLVLRRTKVERAEDIKLPPLNILIRRQKLSDEELDFYEALYKQSKTQFNTYVESGTLLHNFAHIFDLLSRLRQAVDHPYLIIHGPIAAKAELSGFAQLPTASRGYAQVCGICVEDISRGEQVDASCQHSFHKLCMEEFIQTAPADGSALGCPVCYSPLTLDIQKATGGSHPTSTCDGASSPETDSTPPQPRKGILSRIKVAEFQSSTKIELLIQELNMAFTNDPSSKAIVFSQFSCMLDLIEFRVKKEGISCVKFTGSLTMEARQNILIAFNTDLNLRVILISLKAGGEGLNLQIASNIFLMDPWWNPAAEMQAIQRAHRIGQTKPVRAVRFIAEGTIEERILQLQEKKQLVFDGTVGSSAVAFQKLTSEDLRFLFN